MKGFIFIICIGLLLVGFFSGSYYYESNNKPTKVKILVGDTCLEGTMTIEEWYFQQKLWVKIDRRDLLTQICN